MNLRPAVSQHAGGWPRTPESRVVTPTARLASVFSALWPTFQSIHAPADSSGTASLPSDRDGLEIRTPSGERTTWSVLALEEVGITLPCDAADMVTTALPPVGRVGSIGLAAGCRTGGERIRPAWTAGPRRGEASLRSRWDRSRRCGGQVSPLEAVNAPYLRKSGQFRSLSEITAGSSTGQETRKAGSFQRRPRSEPGA
jgi:hypothetical protein